MLEAIYPDGTIEWFCHNKKCEFHTVPLMACVEHDSVRYLNSNQNDRFPADIEDWKEDTRGSMIALPKCICGSQMFLKAHYTEEELIEGRVLIENPFAPGFIMKLSHTRNLILCNMLYLLKKIPEAPIIKISTNISHLLQAGASFEMACNFFFTYQLIPDTVVQIPGFDMKLLQTEDHKRIEVA